MSFLLKLTQNQNAFRRLTTNLFKLQKTNIIYTQPMTVVRIQFKSTTVQEADIIRTLQTQQQQNQDILKASVERTLDKKVGVTSENLTRMINKLQESIKSRFGITTERMQVAIDLAGENIEKVNEAIFILEAITYWTPTLINEQKVDLLTDFWSKISNRNLFDPDLTSPELFVYYKYLNCLTDLKPNNSEIEKLAKEISTNEKYRELKPQFYEILLKSYSLNGNLEKSNEIIDLMNKESITLSLNIFNSLIVCYLKNNNEKQALKIYELMKQRNLKANSQTYLNIFKHYLCNYELHGVSATNMSKFKKYSAQMKNEIAENSGVKLNVKQKIDLLIEAINNKKSWEKEQLVQIINELDIKPTSHIAYGMLLRVLLLRGDQRVAHEIFEYVVNLLDSANSGQNQQEVTNASSFTSIIDNIINIETVKANMAKFVVPEDLPNEDDLNTIKFKICKEYTCHLVENEMFSTDLINNLSEKFRSNKINLKFFVDSLLYNLYTQGKYTNAVEILIYLLDNGYYTNGKNKLELKRQHYLPATNSCLNNLDKQGIEKIGELMTKIKLKIKNNSYLNLFAAEIRYHSDVLDKEKLTEFCEHLFCLKDTSDYFKELAFRSLFIRLFENDLKESDELLTVDGMSSQQATAGELYNQMYEKYGDNFLKMLKSNFYYENTCVISRYVLEQNYVTEIKFKHLDNLLRTFADIKRLMEPDVYFLGDKLCSIITDVMAKSNYNRESVFKFIELLLKHKLKIASQTKINGLARELDLNSDETAKFQELAYKQFTENDYKKLLDDVEKSNSIGFIENALGVLKYFRINDQYVEQKYVYQILRSNDMKNIDKLIECRFNAERLTRYGRLNDKNLIGEMLNFYCYQVKQRDDCISLLSDLYTIISNQLRSEVRNTNNNNNNNTFTFNLAYINDLLKMFVGSSNDKQLHQLLTTLTNICQYIPNSLDLSKIEQIESIIDTIKSIFPLVTDPDTDRLLSELYKFICKRTSADNSSDKHLIDLYMVKKNFDKVKEMDQTWLSTSKLKPKDSDKHNLHFNLLDTLIERKEYANLQSIVDLSTEFIGDMLTKNDLLCSLIRKNCIQEAETLLDKDLTVSNQRILVNILSYSQKDRKKLIDFLKNLIYLLQKRNLNDYIDNYLFILFDKLKVNNDLNAIETLKNYYINSTNTKLPEIVTDLLENKLTELHISNFYKYLHHQAYKDDDYYNGMSFEETNIWNYLTNNNKTAYYSSKIDSFTDEKSCFKYLFRICDTGDFNLMKNLIENYSKNNENKVKSELVAKWCRYLIGYNLVKQKRYEDLFKTIESDTFKTCDYIETPMISDLSGVDQAEYDRLENDYSINLGNNSIDTLKRIYNLLKKSDKVENRANGLNTIARAFLLLHQYDAYFTIMNGFKFIGKSINLPQIVRKDLLNGDMKRINVIIESIGKKDDRLKQYIFENILFHYLKKSDFGKVEETINEMRNKHNLDLNNIKDPLRSRLNTLYQVYKPNYKLFTTTTATNKTTTATTTSSGGDVAIGV